MAEDGDTVAEDVSDFDISFIVDITAMCIVFQGGFCAPIVAMYDRYDMVTDDPEQVHVLEVAMPGEGLSLYLYWEDICPPTTSRQ